MPKPKTATNPKNTAFMPTLRKDFDHKNTGDWLIVGVMSIPLVVLSIFGVLYLIQLANLKS